MIPPVTGFDLLSYQTHIKIKRDGVKTFILDPLRRKYVLITPEEMIRQLLIQGLITKNYPLQRMSAEKTFSINGLGKRFDVLVYTRQLQPWMLVECKAADYQITQRVFDQVLGYNYHFQVPYVLVTNGRDTYCLEVDNTIKAFTFLTEIPQYPAEFTS